MVIMLPQTNVLLGLAGVFLLLTIATGIIYLLPSLRSASNATELQQRVKSWWMIVIIITIALCLNHTIALIFFAFLSFLALKEYLSLIPTRRVDRRVLFWAYLAIPIQYYWIYSNWYVMFLIFVPIYVFLFLPMRMVLLGETQGFLKAAGTLHWGLMLVVFNLGHLAYLLMLPSHPAAVAGGAGLLFYLIFLTEFNDIAQYVWGKTLGRHKVVPKVSPKKTVEGLVGGVLTTILLAWGLAPWFTPFDTLHALGIGLLLGMTGFIGDITISALKRDLGIKDSGNLIPGHGGVLDRIDSLTYTAPLFFHYTAYFYYQGFCG